MRVSIGPPRCPVGGRASSTVRVRGRPLRRSRVASSARPWVRLLDPVGQQLADRSRAAERARRGRAGRPAGRRGAAGARNGARAPRIAGAVGTPMAVPELDVAARRTRRGRRAGGPPPAPVGPLDGPHRRCRRRHRRAVGGGGHPVRAPRARHPVPGVPGAGRGRVGDRPHPPAGAPPPGLRRRWPSSSRCWWWCRPSTTPGTTWCGAAICGAVGLRRLLPHLVPRPPGHGLRRRAPGRRHRPDRRLPGPRPRLPGLPGRIRARPGVRPGADGRLLDRPQDPDPVRPRTVPPGRWSPSCGAGRVGQHLFHAGS